MVQGGAPDAALVVLQEILAESRALGFLGPGPVEDHVAHGRRFAAVATAVPEVFLDLGAGGGVPGLVLALEWSGSQAVLLDAATRRTEFLREACSRLGLEDRVRVVTARAEDAARDPDLRSAFDLVVARSFGPPAVTAECAIGFLRVGGKLIVSEPPEDVTGRWPEAELRSLGFRIVGRATAMDRFVTLELPDPCDARWPRRTGVPAKRLLW